ncbi:protein shuttle craft [Cimex lectularius]|uniref:Shuttle craft n=1 Tax=Cimex lectularius TaxID=79782 RepID=A0A8I6RBN3_CIMLE|nr:protein shuttle craft [Cimex lectularius]XP_014242993.1 protein shuttle craft [Cimex lectularius]
MDNWGWNGAYSVRQMMDPSVSGQDSYYNSGTHYFQQSRQYETFGSNVMPPPGFAGQGSINQSNEGFYDCHNDYNQYGQYQGNYLPTMVYSSSSVPNSNSQWYDGNFMNNYSSDGRGFTRAQTSGTETREIGAPWMDFMPSTSNLINKPASDAERNTRHKGRNDRIKFNPKQFQKNQKLLQQQKVNNVGLNQNSKPRDNWEAKPYNRKKQNTEAEYFSHDDAKVILDNIEESSQLENKGRQNQKKTNWRNNGKKQWRNKRADNAVCQRERLIEQLVSGTLECLVCCERVRHQDSVWSCSNCYHIFHLYCTVKWASSSKDDNGWRCPACQNITKSIPSEYTCMCGKVQSPEFIRGETPHCCGQICGRKKDCPHGCTILCHPGPCPQCCANIKRSCGCGRTNRTVLCSSTVTIECESVCEKTLNCGVHACNQICHQGNCSPCDKKIDQECYCGQNKRTSDCDGSLIPPEIGGPTQYECGSRCMRRLSCGSHDCPLLCHPGPCPKCDLDPEVLRRCPCGGMEIPEGSRTKCTDPVPLCGKTCNKILQCGPEGERHCCKSSCHEGDCPPCEQVSKVKCRCGHIEKSVPCIELSSSILCQKRCTKKRSCGKHKCNQVCCVSEEHICPLPCNKSLNCGRHKCERLCHRGHCSPCLAASFEELHCECGKSVILPPVPCGTRPPECNEPCTRSHPCNHAPLHNCHSFPECPPCSVLTTKYCFGAHEMRKTVPCHLGEYSCGLPCGRPLACGHKCNRRCHDGACLGPEDICVQPCTTIREGGCDHPCANPCHPDRPCPTNTPCLAKLKVTCECGRRSVIRTCTENHSEYQRIATSLLANKIANVRLGNTVEASDMSSIAKKMSLKTLECNEECRKYERNLRLAVSLQIANPDLSSKFSPRYSDSMKAWAKKDSRFCEMVHDKLTQLVQLAKQSKQKSRSYSFPSMGAVKRQFVHEYCEHFGVESVAYDPEPNRNIVATAYKEKCWMPSYSLMEVVQRESGHRKVPSLLPSLKKDVPTKETTRLVPVKKVQLQPHVLAKHEPDLGDSP